MDLGVAETMGEMEVVNVHEFIETTPSDTEIQTIYMPVTNHSGWHISNTLREQLINRRLLQCAEWEEHIIPMCEDLYTDPQEDLQEEDSFWDSGWNRALVMILSATIGAMITNSATK